MSIFDILPEQIRKYIPGLNKKQERHKLLAELDALQDKLKKVEQNLASASSTEAGQSNAAEANTELAQESVAQVDDVNSKIEHIKSLLAATETPIHVRIFKVGMYIVPLVLSYFLAIYLQQNNGLVLEQQEMIRPLGFYQLEEGDSAKFVLSADYQERFWQDFPLYYFTPKNERKDIDNSLFFFDDSVSIIETKLILSNSSSSFPLMVSTLQVEISKVEESSFPWEKLNTTPVLEHAVQGEDLFIKNTGYAPALNLALTYHLSPTDSLTFDDYDILYGEQSILEDVLPDYGEYDIAEVDYSSNKLMSAFYVYHNPAKRKKESATYKTINGHEFQSIESPSDLSMVTEVLEVKEIAMDLTYTSVTEEPFKMTWKTQFEFPAYYYIYADDLLTYEEARRFDPEATVVDYDQDGVADYLDREVVAAVGEKLYTALGNKPEFHPEGVSLITETIRVDLENLPAGAMRSGFKNTDQILNPDGFVIIYLKMVKPSNGKYRVRLKANDKFISEFYVETLIPEESEFHYPESLIYFKQEEAVTE